MLGKLFKYELKATARLFLPLYLTIIIFALISRFIIPINSIGTNSSLLYNLITTVSMFIYVVLMIGLVLMTLVVMIQRFNKSLLGDEGYLMFTLPIQSHKHIFSKLVVSILWTLASGVTAICSMLIVASNSVSIATIVNDIKIAFSQFTQFYGSLSGIVILEFIVFGLLSLAFVILTIYAAIALGHLFNKYKLLISFGMYILLKIAAEMFIMIFAYIVMNQELFNEIPTAAHINKLFLIGCLCYGILVAAYYSLTNFILKRKLNLE